MSRPVNLYGSHTRAAAQRAVKNFNAKITRELKKDPAAAAWLPERMSMKQFRAENTTRKDINDSLARLRRFSSRGAADPVELNDKLVRTAWEVRETLAQVEATNKRRARDLRALKPSTERGTMGTVERNNLRPMNVPMEKMSLKEWQAKRHTAATESKASYKAMQMAEYKNNYLKAVWYNLGAFGQPILDLVQSLPPSVFVAAYKQNPILDIEYIYDPQEAAYNALNILEAWYDFLGMEQTAEEDMMTIYEGEDMEDFIDEYEL